MMKSHKKIASFFGIFLFAVVLVLTENVSFVRAAKGTETANLRLIFTTDIHGQINSTDYETGTTLLTGGLARAFSLIKQARAENQDYLTFDIGDVIYDYTTEFIYAKNQSVVQPVYQAMNQIGYDAVTLGNHEFDYDYDYLKSQLRNSGMMDKVIVSNLTDSKTGEHPFLENMLITKELTTTSGKKIPVKVGVIGETLPVLSSKGQNFTGVLKVHDIIENVQQQATKLKENGADIIVVLSHSGMGVEKPQYMDKNVSYALTKLDDVDVVLCGHEHNAFPSKDTSGAYYKLSGVDKKTNLVNGKNLIMAQDRGQSIGVVDLTIEQGTDGIKITDRKSELRVASAATVNEDSKIASLYDEWSSEMKEYTEEVIGNVKEEDLIENYTGLVEDSSAIQLINDAKRAYAIKYIYNNAKEYIDYPVIAASTYVTFGENSYLDFVNISGKLTESDLASLQGYNGYTAIYWITGAQLKEWIEWSASAYTQTNSNEVWTDKTMKQYIASSGANSLIAEDWIDSWNKFYVFDGVNYTINPMIAPRYNVKGVKINQTNRVVELTYNGKPVTDSQVFVLSIGKLAKTVEANKGIDKQSIYKGYVRTQGVIRDYIEQRCKLGSLVVKPDNNWNLALPNNYQFVTKTTKLAEKKLANTDWFKKTLGVADNYIYGLGSFSDIKSKEIPKILLTSTYTDATSQKLKVAVNATSRSGIEDIRYKKGSYDATNKIWSSINSLTEGYFYADSNDIYSVYVKDKSGNVVVEQIKIDNIYSGVLKKPIVDSYTNRKTKISGKGDKGSTILIETPIKTYKTTVDSDGKFSYALPAQPSGTTITLQALNEETNDLSEKVTVTVKRTGPNQPKVYGAYNNSDQIKGNLNDTDAAVIAIVNNKVYVGDEETAELYRGCKDIYSEKMPIIVTDVFVDSSYEYSLKVPVQKIGSTISIYTLDHICRVSRVQTVTVEDCAPNPPLVYEVTAADNQIEGYVSSSKANTIFTVNINVGNENYLVKTDKAGYFCQEVSPSMLSVGTKISVYAFDVVNNINRKSLTTELTVEDPEKYVSDDTDLVVYALEAKDTTILGKNDLTDIVTVAVKSGSNYTVYKVAPDSNGSFEVNLVEPLKASDVLYAHTMSNNGTILEMIKSQVSLVAPDTVTVPMDINNNTKTVVVNVDVEATAVIKIGDKTYESNDFTYDDAQCIYQLNVTIPMTSSGTKLTIYAYNSEGKSAESVVTVKRVVPDAPLVNPVTTSSEEITGAVTIVGKTKISAKIGDKTYKGKVSEDGSFKIKIPKQKAKEKIKVWATNEVGKGIATTIKVTKETSKK